MEMIELRPVIACILKPQANLKSTAGLNRTLATAAPMSTTDRVCSIKGSPNTSSSEDTWQTIDLNPAAIITEGSGGVAGHAPLGARKHFSRKAHFTLHTSIV